MSGDEQQAPMVRLGFSTVNVRDSWVPMSCVSPFLSLKGPKWVWWWWVVVGGWVTCGYLWITPHRNPNRHRPPRRPRPRPHPRLRPRPTPRRLPPPRPQQQIRPVGSLAHTESSGTLGT